MNYVWINEDNMDDFKRVLPWELVVDRGNICIGAVDEDDRINGVICYGYADCQIDILWLFVPEQVRRKGVATGLMDKMMELIRKSGQLYPISVRFEGNDEMLYLFFLSYEGMEISYSHDRYVLKPNDIYKGRYPLASGKESLKEVRFFDLPATLQQNIIYLLNEEQGLVTGDFEEWKRTLVPDLCRCILRDDKPLALIFLHRLSANELELSYLYSINPMALAELIAGVVADIESSYPDCRLVFDAVNNEAAGIARKIFPNMKSVPVYEAEYI